MDLDLNFKTGAQVRYCKALQQPAYVHLLSQLQMVWSLDANQVVQSKFNLQMEMSWCVKYTQDFSDLKKKECKDLIKHDSNRASLVVEWLGVHWSMQGHGFDLRSRKIPHGAERHNC